MLPKHKDRILAISASRTLQDVMSDFNLAYPYLKIEFYKNSNGKERARVNHLLPLSAVGLKRKGEIVMRDSMTVGQLEKLFIDKFGLFVQVSRKSGTTWLETTMTDQWTLKQQNDHGKELSQGSKPRQKPEEESDQSVQ